MHIRNAKCIIATKMNQKRNACRNNILGESFPWTPTKCNSSVSTDDHEDDFLTLEISHQEHFRTASQQLKMILEPRKSRIILGQKSLNHFSAQFSLTACTKLKMPKNPVKYAHQCKRKKYRYLTYLCLNYICLSSISW